MSNVAPRPGKDGRYHFLYVTWDEETFEWYGGKHSTANLSDGYRGSGDWIRTHPDPARLRTEPIEFFATEEVAYAAERIWITPKLIEDDLLCRNWTEGGIGWTAAGIANLRAKMTPAQLAQWTRKKSASVTAALKAKSFDELSAKGRQAWANKTQDQRSEIARRAWASHSPEQQAAKLANLVACLKKSWRRRTDEEKTRINAQRSRSCRVASAKITCDEHSARIRSWLAKNSPERRSEIARKRWASRTPEERSAIVKKSNATRRARQAEAQPAFI